MAAVRVRERERESRSAMTNVLRQARGSGLEGGGQRGPPLLLPNDVAIKFVCVDDVDYASQFLPVSAPLLQNHAPAPICSRVG